MTDVGFVGAAFSEEWNGGSKDGINKVVVEEIAKRDTSAAGTLTVHQTGPYVILKFELELPSKKVFTSSIKQRQSICICFN